MKTEEIIEQLKTAAANVAEAETALVALQKDEHARKCPLVNSARAATTAANERIENAVKWVEQNPVPAAPAVNNSQDRGSV